MAKVEITVPGERIVESFTALVRQPTTPSTARSPDVGLVEVSQVNPTELIPGPPGPPGPIGGVGPPGTTTWDGITDKPATFPPTLPVPWSGLSGVPATFPPSAHGHPFTEITGTVTDAQHGNRGGGALHATATAATPGFFTDAASDGTQYVRKNGTWSPVTVPPGTYIGDNPPVGATSGQEWWQSSTGNMFIFYVDAGGGAGQWVQTNATAQPVIDDAGKIDWFARSTPPNGWLKANGTAVAVITFTRLVPAIYCGDALNATALFGYRCTDPANPSTTRSTVGAYIVLPDLRGEFVRSFDDGRGVDAARVFGSAQADAVQNITGSFIARNETGGNDIVYHQSGAFITSAGASISRLAIGLGTGAAGSLTTFDASRVVRTAAETRSRNVALLACIRY